MTQYNNELFDKQIFIPSFVGIFSSTKTMEKASESANKLQIWRVPAGVYF